MKKIFPLLLLPAALACADLRAASPGGAVREGNSRYFGKQYGKALESYSKAAELAPQDGRINFNAGDAHYRLGEFDKAAGQFKTASTDPAINQNAFFNEGNAWYRQGKFREAVQSYKQAILLDAKDDDARHNLVAALLQLKKQCSQCDKDKKDEKDKQNSRDKNKNDKNDAQNKPQDDDPGDRRQNNQGMSREDAQRVLEMAKEKENSPRQQNVMNSQFNKTGQDSASYEDW